MVNQPSIFQPTAQLINQLQPTVKQSAFFQPAAQISNQAQPMVSQPLIFQQASQSIDQLQPAVNHSTFFQPVTNLNNQAPLLADQTDKSSDKIVLDDVICKGHILYQDLAFKKTVCDTDKALDATQRFLYDFPGANYLSVARVIFFQQSHLLLTAKFKCCSPPFLLLGFRLLMNSQQYVLLLQKTANTSFVLALMKRTT